MPLEGAAEAWTRRFSRRTSRCNGILRLFGRKLCGYPDRRADSRVHPASTRAEREQRTKDVSHFAAAIGVKSIACHVGFVPEDRTIRTMSPFETSCGGSAITLPPRSDFAMETDRTRRSAAGIPEGRGSEESWHQFRSCELIMYGSGDPIQAVEVLHEHLFSVHCKDGVWPPKKPPRRLGDRRPLGEGAGRDGQFIAKLKQVGYKGTLNVEREIEDLEQKKIDMRKGVDLLKRLTAS